MNQRKNILLVVVDQWRGDTLPMLGHPVVKTPNIEALAAEGVTFARHYTQDTTTTPTPRVISPHDPHFTVLGADMEGWRPVGFWGMKMEAHSSWVASQGFKLPDDPWDIWLPEGLAPHEVNATNKPSRIPAELSASSL